VTRSLPAPCALACALACALGCSEPVVGVRLRFPSETTFLITNTITVDVYDGEGSGAQSPDAICRALSVTTSVAPEGVQALESSGNTPACALLDGGVTFESVDVGRRVFFAEATDAAGQAILRGCSVADVFGDAADPATLAPDDAATVDALGANALVDVQLATLPTYPEDQVPLCDDVTAKCTENQECF
jgi:hypothetical protein